MSADATQQSDNSSQPCEQTTTNVLQKTRNRDHRKKTRRHLDNVMIAWQNLDSFVENIIKEYNVGNRTDTCAACGTSMVTGETKGHTHRNKPNSNIFTLLWIWGYKMSSHK